MAVSGLPARFPCWCRAVYSWGGETDKDLGFIEGDLIECLNAGDGSWWMGRLRRDRRMMGLFPSNFVVVLEDSFVPVSRSVSPMPELQRKDTSKNSVENLERRKEKAKSRRPFQGYKTPAPVKVESTPVVPIQNLLAQLPQRQASYDPGNPPSRALWQQGPVSRGPSRGPSRSPSPMPQFDIGSSPPPPPPPHRILGDGISRASSPQPQMLDMNDRYQMISRTPSPGIVSLNGHTPPMIRDAMDGVMSSLDGMGIGRQKSYDEPEQPLDPWSPEAFEDLHPNVTKYTPRPFTSIGLTGHGKFSEPRPSYSSRHNSPDRFPDGPPHLETYVERMEKQLRARAEARRDFNNDEIEPDAERDSVPPEPPPKNSPWSNAGSIVKRRLSLRRKSAYDMGNTGLNRTFTTKTSSTSSSSGVQSQATNSSNQSSRTNQSIMSGYSAGGFSATSAGSLARRNVKNAMLQQELDARPKTSSGIRNDIWGRSNDLRPFTPNSGLSMLTSHDSRAGARSAVGWSDNGPPSTAGALGGFTTPRAKKTGLWKRFTDTGKTAFASARSTIVPTSGEASSRSSSPTKHFTNPLTGIAGGTSISPKKQEMRNHTEMRAYGRDAAREMGLMGGGEGNSWVASRRDVNRSNSPGPAERQERVQRCQMLNEPVIAPVDELFDTFRGDEGADGQPVMQPFKLINPSFSLVDKAARFITNLPSSVTASNLATSQLCRPYRSDVQRLRAIFIWVSERISWEDDAFDSYRGRPQLVDTRRVIQSRRGNSRDVAHLVMEMCHAIGLQAEVVHGYLKSPGEELDLDAATPGKVNHFWNAVSVDGEWRMMDACLASPTNPRRLTYSNVSPSIAEAWYFLAKPSELCWTHVPIVYEQQHMIPAVSPDTLLALPGACPSFFRLGLGVHSYDTSCIRLDGLEMCTISLDVPADVEIVAEVETKAYLQDNDGDVYEDAGGIVATRVLSQANWYQPSTANPDVINKRFIVKALLPGDEGSGVLKIYAGKKGLMHSAREIVHPLAFAVPLYHTGENPPYEFVRRHPTPHATRQDLYVVQPQCFKLAHGENYIFCVRQHPAHAKGSATPHQEQNGFDARPVSPNPMVRPASALSMTSSAAGGSIQGSEASSNIPGAAGVKVKEKPAKLAIQSPGGRIIRLARKHEGLLQTVASREIDGAVVGSAWEACVKVTEAGVWRGLVLADRSARWCVWGEWACS